MHDFPRYAAITTAALVATFTPSSAHAGPPDLCDDRLRTADGDLYEDSTGQTISRWCEPHTNPPSWGGDVCCSITDEANCEPPTPSGRCASGMRFTCEYGEQLGEAVVCYQPGPSSCELGFCADDIFNPNGDHVFVDTIWNCCIDKISDLICTYAGETNNGEPPDTECGGFFTICSYGQTNLDGTITCYG